MKTKTRMAAITSYMCLSFGAVALIGLSTPSQGATSINSTSQNGGPASPVPQRPKLTGGANGFQVFPANDLGMHCGDLDTRISSILPPLNIMHVQVIRQGKEPDLLGGGKVSVFYSAAANPSDPALSTPIPANLKNPAAAGDPVFKTNFWNTVNAGAYDPFYPPSVTPLSVPADRGLPVPDLEALYPAGGGAGSLVANQQDMPGINGPYVKNVPKGVTVFANDLPFFVNFDFGYRVKGVKWFEGPGIPLTGFDDSGRENAYPLMRVEARQGGQVVATTDVVLPISGEANCQGCHAAKVDGGNGTAIGDLPVVATSMSDPQVGNIPLEVSREYAADINLLKLHDIDQGTQLITGTTLDPDPQTSGNKTFKPVVCQVCHYSPALDLAHVGPKGPGDADVNGRDQTNNQTMSRVMHHFHGNLKSGGKLLFPTMPSPVGRSVKTTQNILDQTCYQCHPGKRTQCLRGAMGSANVVCQDCHGQMDQVGNDFSRNMPGGNFIVKADFYTNPNTPRVPWANEPGCGSCHTGDALNNLAGTSGTLVNPTDSFGNTDGIRLLRAYKSGDAKATPIVPTNKRFAEDTVPSGPAKGNPMLFRVSNGHEGVFCEACHGSTHAIWPNAKPNANDNVAAEQLQGHSGKIVECTTCHTGDLGNTLDGPHGMHPVGNVKFVRGGHEDLAEENLNACATCHGDQGQGTVLSKVAVNRTLTNIEDVGTLKLSKNELVNCGLCHDNPLGGGGGGNGGGGDGGDDD